MRKRERDRKGEKKRKAASVGEKRKNRERLSKKNYGLWGERAEKSKKWFRLCKGQRRLRKRARKPRKVTGFGQVGRKGFSREGLGEGSKSYERKRGAADKRKKKGSSAGQRKKEKERRAERESLGKRKTRTAR